MVGKVRQAEPNLADVLDEVSQRHPKASLRLALHATLSTFLRQVSATYALRHPLTHELLDKVASLHQRMAEQQAVSQAEVNELIISCQKVIPQFKHFPANLEVMLAAQQSLKPAYHMEVIDHTVSAALERENTWQMRRQESLTRETSRAFANTFLQELAAIYARQNTPVGLAPDTANVIRLDDWRSR